MVVSVNVELVKIRTIFELTGGRDFNEPANMKSMVRSSIFLLFFNYFVRNLLKLLCLIIEEILIFNLFFNFIFSTTFLTSSHTKSNPLTVEILTKFCKMLNLDCLINMIVSMCYGNHNVHPYV